MSFVGSKGAPQLLPLLKEPLEVAFSQRMFRVWSYQMGVSVYPRLQRFTTVFLWLLYEATPIRCAMIWICYHGNQLNCFE